MSFLNLFFLLSFSAAAVALSQDPSPTIAQCTTRLLPLAPCGPFVQGSMQSPAQLCCDNLKQLYTQQPRCLCLLLNDTTLSSFPINSSLALQLPLLCSVQIDISVCSAGVNGSTSPGSQVSLGSTGTNSSTAVNSTAASPVIQTVPRSNSTTTGHGLANSGGINLRTGSDFVVVMASAFITSVLTEGIL